jgi:hypothetical protein
MFDWEDGTMGTLVGFFFVGLIVGSVIGYFFAWPTLLILSVLTIICFLVMLRRAPKTWIANEAMRLLLVGGPLVTGFVLGMWGIFLLVP